ncbi:MAG: aromatic ring-hydroxylating dioxygenase subunit alpha [Chloroflexi bacterium]|nr:aromatic ring-hydroxylating dioxygenase subunit alpha [Chloroflexota bacterium]
MNTAPLRPYWYPVARADEIGDGPMSTQLLGERLAVYRGKSGRYGAFRDLCIHRGTPLSLGWVDGDELVCAYHGWAYAESGQCTRIPSLPEGRPIPAKARASAFPARERHGLVWVALEEPVSDVAAFPEADDPSYRTIWTTYHWKASAPRVIENVMDFAHFPWVHPGVLGHREKPVYPDVAIERTGGGFAYTVDDEATNAIRRYTVSLPLALHMWVGRRGAAGPAAALAPTTAPDERITGLFFAARPITERETMFYFGHARNFALDQADAVWAERNTSVTEQDRRIVEAQRPEELPLDLSAELHLKGSDAPAVEYRRALARMGIEAQPGSTS